jgi:hypothetical protein
MSRRSLTRDGSFQYYFDRPEYTVAPGGTAALTLFLWETFDPRAEEPRLAPGTDGLVSAGVVVRVGDLLLTDPDRAPTIRATLGNTEFDFGLVARPPAPEFPGSAGLVELATKPVFGEVVSRTPTCVSVLLPLGAFTFAAPADAEGVTFLTALVTDGYPDTCDEKNVTDSGAVLDHLIRPGMAMVRVSAEPPAAKPGRASDEADALAARYTSARRRGR